MVTVRAALETLYCDRMSLSRAVPELREDGAVFGREESLPGEIPCRLSYTGGFLERYRPEPLLRESATVFAPPECGVEAGDLLTVRGRGMSGQFEAQSVRRYNSHVEILVKRRVTDWGEGT